MTVRWIVIMLAGTVLWGCTAAREGIPLSVSTLPDPATGGAVRLILVDNRRFEPRFSKVSRPSSGTAADGALKDRLFARAGPDMPPLLLAGDTSVTRIVHETLANALRASGYRVVGANDPAHAAAQPLVAELDTFWAWTVVVAPEQVAVHYYQCDIELRFDGEWPLADDAERRVRGSEWMFRQAATDANWAAVLTECLGEIDYVLKRALKKSGNA